MIIWKDAVETGQEVDCELLLLLLFFVVVVV